MRSIPRINYPLLLRRTMWIRNRTQIPHNLNRIHPHLRRLLYIKHITQLGRIPKEHIKRHLQPQHGIIQLQRISHRLVVQRDLTGGDICADDLFQFIVVETEAFDGVHFEIVVAEIAALVFGGQGPGDLDAEDDVRDGAVCLEGSGGGGGVFVGVGIGTWEKGVSYCC